MCESRYINMCGFGVKKILRISQLVTFILAMEQQDKRECVNCVDVIVLNVGNK